MAEERCLEWWQVLLGGGLGGAIAYVPFAVWQRLSRKRGSAS